MTVDIPQAMPPSPEISIVSPSHHADPPTQLEEPPADPTWYPLNLDESNNTLHFGPPVKTDKLEPETAAIGAFLYSPDGSLYFESYTPSHNVYLAPSFTRANNTRTLVRCSVPGGERFYAIIYQDVTLEVEGVPAKIILKYNSQERIQVQHSYVVPETTEPRGTPERTVNQVVSETPAVEKRHIDPNSSRRTEVRVLRDGLMAGGVPAGTRNQDEETESDTEDVEGKVVRQLRFESTERPMEMDELDEHLSSGKPRGVDDETEDQEANYEETPKQDEGKDKDDKGQHIIHHASDSLPEAFGYEEAKKLRTPARTYGKQSHFSSKKASAKKQTSPHDSTHTRGQPVILRKPREDNEDDRLDEALPAVLRKGPRAHARKVLQDSMDLANNSPEAHGDILFSTAPEDSPALPPTSAPVPETPVTNGKPKQPEPTSKPTKKSAKSAEREKPRSATKRKKASPEPAPLKANNNDTQYTFLGSDTEVDEEGETLGTPAAKRRKASPASTKSKTPKSVKSTKTPRTTSAKKPKAPVTPPVDEETKSKLRTTKAYDGPSPRIAFTNSVLPEDKAIARFLRTHSAKIISNPSDPTCNFLITGTSTIKRTPKFIISVARGIPILSGTWLRESLLAGYFLDPSSYHFFDPRTEVEWGFKLKDAIERGRKGGNRVLEGWTVHLTGSLVAQCRKDGTLEALEEMCEVAGAVGVVKKTPRGGSVEGVLVLGKEEGDKDLGGLKKAGWVLRGTAVVGMSVFRGKLQLGEEFLIT